MEIKNLIEDNMFILKKCASMFYNSSIEDLYQAGSLGLVKAYKNYKKNGTTKFSTYAFDYVYGEMYMFVHKNQKIMISKEIKKLAKLIEDTRNKISQRLGKIASNEDVASFLEMDPNKINEVTYLANNHVVSLDNTLNDDNNLYEIIPEKVTISMDDKLNLEMGVEKLEEPYKSIIKEHFYNDLTQTEIAKKLNITQVMVSRYMKQSLQELRSHIAA